MFRRVAGLPVLPRPDLAAQRTGPALSAAYEEAFGVLLGAVEDCQKAGIVRGGFAWASIAYSWSRPSAVAIVPLLLTRVR